MTSRAHYKLATYDGAAGEQRAGIVVDDRLVDIPGRSVLQLLQQWPETREFLQRVASEVTLDKSSHSSVPLAEARFLAPVLYPSAIFCAGANYRDHVAEMSKALNLPEESDPHEIGLKPWHFLKPPIACIRGTGTTISLPAYSKQVDWEAEIAVVIGRPCKNVAVENALEYVAGLSIVNDLSARDHLRRSGVARDSPFHFDWVSQKSFDGALPFGPWITPLDHAGDIANLGIRLWVNEELMQDSSSSQLIFTMAEQIAHLSTRLTLLPGDVIATGTPAGCGAARGRFLKPGDRVSVWVENIGILVNEFVG